MFRNHSIILLNFTSTGSCAQLYVYRLLLLVHSRSHCSENHRSSKSRMKLEITSCVLIYLHKCQKMRSAHRAQPHQQQRELQLLSKWFSNFPLLLSTQQSATELFPFPLRHIQHIPSLSSAPLKTAAANNRSDRERTFSLILQLLLLFHISSGAQSISFVISKSHSNLLQFLRTLHSPHLE